MSEGDHLIEYAAQAPYIRLLIVRFFLANFWRKIIRSSNSSLSAIIGVLKNPSNPKVSNFNLVVLGHEDVLRLQVSVQDFPVMNVLYC